MASIYSELEIDVEADAAWAALRQAAEARTWFAPVLTDSGVDGDVRTVRFANGMVVHERILHVDDQRRRVSYSAMDGPGLTFHHASMKILAEGPGRCRFVWITDFLPKEAGAQLAPLIEQGSHALKNNLERDAKKVR